MKKYIKKVIRELDIGAPSKYKRKEIRHWIMEYKWKSEKEYQMYPKGYLSGKELSLNWTKVTMKGKFISAKAVEESLKSQLRNPYWAEYIKGRFWRARNEVTGEIIEFINIENYYL